jgi:hypothetical protein
MMRSYSTLSIRQFAATVLLAGTSGADLKPTITAPQGLSGETIPVSISFKQGDAVVPVSGVTEQHIMVEGGQLRDFAPAGRGYTFNITPATHPPAFSVSIAGGAARNELAVFNQIEPRSSFASWAHQLQITFPGYEPHRGTLRNFPVLIVLEEHADGMRFADFRGSAETPWADLRFTLADFQTELSYEVESWGKGGRSRIWVNVPAFNAETVLHAFWGKPGQTAPSYSSDASTWKSDFTAVWHMGNLHDASGAGHHGEIVGTGVKEKQPGRIGDGVRTTQSGGPGGIKVADDDRLDFEADDFTVEMWVSKHAHSKGWSNIGEFGKWHTGAQPGKNEWSLGTTQEGDDDRPGFSVEIGTTSHRVNAADNLLLNEWTHIVGVRNGEVIALYVDGIEAGRKDGVKGSVNNVGRDLYFGYFQSTPALSTRATLDEYRISARARSADWIYATHQTIAANARFVCYQFPGAEPERSVAATQSFESHWAYEKPRRPALPKVSDPAWPQHPIDHFVLARLDRKGLKPRPPAEPITWLRRVSFDLTGLPPTLDEIDTFIADTDPGAKARVVDRLLAAPQFGERWAQPWLDLARYGDSTGLHEDEIRPSWAWRDWVIAALNADMPFDQFTVEQLAGDLLPNATLEQKIATGFHRAAPMMLEGGTPKEAARSAQVIDRVNVTGTVWLGTTFECAQCHDHKSDPISQRDYYRLFAYFNNTPGEFGKSVGPGRSAMAGATVAFGDTTTFVMQEMAKPRQTRVYERGSYEHPKETVNIGLPRTLFDSPVELPANRLGLAQWLVNPDHPLTARVTVNRWWAELFGAGLVRTVDDFGKLGMRPSHPQLLDWLAVELVEQGWSFKHMLRGIVLSATYSQSSIAPPELRATDPDNIWLARASRLRLSAEAVRDNALAIAGLLSPAIGGPPAYPPQPEDLWWIRDDKSPKYVTSHGEDRYRRSLYTIWRRTFLHPSLAVFDAPDRITCAFDRERSNTPLQALTLLNDPIYTEAAFGFARELVSRPGSDLDRIKGAFRRATARQPDAEEITALEDLLRSRFDQFEADPDAAITLVNAVRGELLTRVSPLDQQAFVKLAAWFHVTNVLLNLDETITRE